MSTNEFNHMQYVNLARNHKRILLIAALVIMTVVTVVSYLLPNKYEAKSTVFIEKSVIAELVKGLAATPSVDEKLKALTYAMRSRTLIQKVMDDLDLNLKKSSPAEQEQLIKKLQDNTQIKVKDREGLFIISFTDASPKLARDFVNTLVRRYIEENMSSKREDSYGATKFLGEQAQAFREKLQKSEDAVNSFKQGSGSVATMDPSLLLKDINDSQQRLDDLKIKEAQLETQLAGMSKSVTVQSNLPALQKRLQELQLQYTDNYPDIIRLKEDIRVLEAQGRTSHGTGGSQSPEYQRAASELRATRQAISNLGSIIARNRGTLQQIPAARSKLEDLEREKNAQKIIYEQMMSRQSQSEVSKQMEVQDKSTVFRIVDPAVLPVKPVSPNRVKLILLGIVAGIGGGFGLVMLRDMMDSSIKNADMAKQLGLPLLAIVPRIEEPEKLAAQLKLDRRLYAFSGAYFTLILAVLAAEKLGFMVRLIDKISG